jgi:hypothetical protein
MVLLTECFVISHVNLLHKIMISISILAFSSLLAIAQNPEPHVQKVIVKNSEIITELGSESNTDTSKEISISIHASDAHEILSGLDQENGVKVMGSVKMITIDEDGNEQIVEFDLDDMPEGFDFDIQQLGAGSLDGLSGMLEMMRGEHGEHDEHGEHGEHGEHDEHGGVWRFDSDFDMENNMPRMMDMDDMRHNMPRMMDMGNMGEIMIMTQPMMMGQDRNQWRGNDRGDNDIAEEMHHRLDDLEEMVDEMHHRLDDLEDSLENIEAMLHELLERR